MATFERIALLMSLYYRMNLLIFFFFFAIILPNYRSLHAKFCTAPHLLILQYQNGGPRLPCPPPPPPIPLPSPPC